MKHRNAILLIAFIISTVPSLASTGELIASMRRQQKENEEQIVRLWSENKRGETMEQLLSDYVVREVRLRSITGNSQTGTLLSAVVKGGQIQFDNPQAMVQALVVEYYRRKGVNLDGDYFVSGTYMIRKADLKRKGN